MLHRRLWFEALAAATGLELTPAEAPQARDRRRPRLDVRRRTRPAPGRHRAPRRRTRSPLARSKGIARIIKYLSQVDTYGAAYEARELDDAATLLGRRPESVADGRAAVAAGVAAGTLSEEDYLRTLWRRIARETELARPSMGVLADRHWPELR